MLGARQLRSRELPCFLNLPSREFLNLFHPRDTSPYESGPVITMVQPENNLENEGQPNLPEELVEDLRLLYRTDVPVPREVKEAVLATASRRLRGRPRPRVVWRWAAAAAAAVLLVSLWLTYPGDREEPLQTIAFRREDLDRNGRVDILDAFLLARRIDRRQALDPAWDVNGDHVVNGVDVDRIARIAVALDREADF